MYVMVEGVEWVCGNIVATLASVWLLEIVSAAVFSTPTVCDAAILRLKTPERALLGASPLHFLMTL